MKITLLNSSVLTAHGVFEFGPLSLEDAKELVINNEVVSAIGHLSTAHFLSNLLECDIPYNCVDYDQQVGEIALVFKLKSRGPRGKELSGAEIEAIGYDFGILRRLS